MSGGSASGSHHESDNACECAPRSGERVSERDSEQSDEGRGNRRRERRDVERSKEARLTEPPLTRCRQPHEKQHQWDGKIERKQPAEEKERARALRALSRCSRKGAPSLRR